MGETLAMASGVCFAFSVIYLKIGQNARPRENGVFMTSLVNVGMYLALTGAAFISGNVPPLTTAGLVFFVIAGFTNTLIGRWAWLQSVRAIGPSRGTALKVTAPIFSTALAYFFLAQPVTLSMLIGIAIVIAGVVLLTQEPHSQLGVNRQPVSSDEVPSRRRRYSLTAFASPALAQGVLLGLLSAVAYGSGSVLRKLGLDTSPSPFVGALIGSLVATSSVLLSDLLRGNLGQRWTDNVRQVPVPFVITGVFAGFAQLAAFSALMFTTVARSSTISSAQPMFAALLSLAFFRTLDTITPRSVVGMLGICLGVAVVLLA